MESVTWLPTISPMGMRSVVKVCVSVGLATLLVGGLTATGASAEDPLYIPWSQLLPGLTTEYVPGASNDCQAGRIKCVDSVIREMTRRFDPLSDSCSHDAVFALTYLRTTEEYRRSVADGTFFEDTPFVNHQDAIFARYYFEAYDAYHSGNLAATPPAWRIAFDAAKNQKVNASGNLLLGMSAHVNRDLAFVLADIGLVKPDGTSRKPDHDKVNEFLNRVMEPLLAEVAAHYDPAADDMMIDGTTLDATALLQLLVLWREGAWRNAERLVSAPTPAARAQVAQDIENTAALEAQMLVASSSYTPLDNLLGRGAAARNSFCAANHE